MSKPFYGWWIVFGAILCLFVSGSIGHFVSGVFMRPVVEDLNWKIWQYTLGSSLSMAAGTISGLVVGNIVDNRGPRLIMFIGAFVSMGCLLLLSIQSNLLVFLSVYCIGGLMGWNLFNPLVINSTVSKWFIRQRGWALAIGSIGVSMGGLISPMAMTIVVDNLGWRTAYMILAILVIVIIVPIAFVMRRRPEDHELLPDGDAPINDPNGSAHPHILTPEHSQSLETDSQSFRRNEAIRTKDYWLLFIGYGLNGAALMSVLIHAIPFMTDIGFTRSVAAAAITVNGLGNLTSKAVWGYGLQKIRPRKLATTALSISSIGVTLVLISSTNERTSILFLGFLLYGFGYGGTIPLSEFLRAKYFGRAHIGSINGAGLPITTLGSSVGPLLVGYWYDVTNDYRPAFMAIVATFLVGAILISISREPSKKDNPDSLNLKTLT